MENKSSNNNLVYWVVGIIVVVIVIILLVSNNSSGTQNDTNVVPGSNTSQTPATSTQSNTTPAKSVSKTPIKTTVKSNNTPTPSVPAGYPVIHYTGTGFSPSKVTVKAGTPVTFINDSGAGMWIASNPHPTHTDYSDLDEGRTVGKGATFTFAFLKVGSWSFHNHLNPTQGGTVVVTPQ